jgi:hypothetical protein
MGYQEWTIKTGQSRIDNQEWKIKNEQSRMDNQEWTIKNVRIFVPSSALTAAVRQLVRAKQWLTETRRDLYYQFVMQ